jgi:hypothetical protein
MSSRTSRDYGALGLFVCIGLIGLGWLVGGSIVKFKQFERVVSVKGLAEREVPADIVLWPIQFVHAENDLTTLYAGLEKDAAAVTTFLREQGFTDDEITVGTPVITDKVAQAYGGGGGVPLRYSANQSVTVYSTRVDLARQAMRALVGLGKQGVALSGNSYDSQTQFIFTGLNELKPAMVEEATRNAREVAEKFAADSDSRLGKIKRANQGQFSIVDRDANTPHIKKVRVVSTVEYYLSD